MNLLIDSHTLLWFTEGDSSLSDKALDLLNNPENSVFVSMVTFYEFALKVNIGKLKLGKTIKEFYKQTIKAKIEVLPINSIYLSTLSNLPQFPNHKDPFDRLIIATAITDKLTIVSIDSKFELYKELVTIIW